MDILIEIFINEGYDDDKKCGTWIQISHTWWRYETRKSIINAFKFITMSP